MFPWEKMSEAEWAKAEEKEARKNKRREAFDTFVYGVGWLTLGYLFIKLMSLIGID